MKTFKAGNQVNQGYYKSLEPTRIQRKWKLDDSKVINLLSKAERQLGRLDMYSEYIPDIDHFISMHVVKEATQSSKIEGTQTQIEEALMDRERIPPERRDDWDEVINYMQAMNHAILELQHMPFSSRLIRNTHRVLMKGVRGAHKQPGEFRKSQNWIGGTSINDAVFVPPAHESIPDLMSDLEKFVHDEDTGLPDLIKIAIMHYQFETIHPFLDGNGRVGRLLITLYLVHCGILKKPTLYLSDYFEKNRLNYYDHLDIARTTNDMGRWICFFLAGIIETAKSSISTFDGILKLQKKTDDIIRSLGSRAGNGQKVVHHLYKRPIVTAEQVSKAAGVSMPTAYKLLLSLEELKVLQEITGSARGRVYVFTEYLNLYRS